MPTYEYQCKVCGHRFSRFQSMSDSPVETCPECSGEVRRIIGAGTGVIFKGSGFYATDYRSTRPECGRDRTCCGRETPCADRPCKS
jgi:putative FmdB family regulatory protein